MKRKTKLTIETERIFVIRRSGEAERRAVCEACQEVVHLLSLEEAATLTRMSARAIYRLVEAEKIHFTETTKGLLLICSKSVRRILLEADTARHISNWEGESHES